MRRKANHSKVISIHKVVMVKFTTTKQLINFLPNTTYRRISIGRRYLSEKKAERGGGDRGNQYTGGKTVNFTDKPTDEKLSTEYNVSSPTVRRYAKEAEQYERLIHEELLPQNV